MSANVTGVYELGGEAAGIDGVMSGSFAGAGAETVAGGISIAVDNNGGTPIIFEGVFAGQRP